MARSRQNASDGQVVAVYGRPPAPSPTEFGRYLQHLMSVRGVGGSKGLAALMNERGHKVSQQSISNYKTGKSKAPTDFVEALIDTLGLTPAQQVRLGVFFAYGQGEEFRADDRVRAARPGPAS